MISLLLQYLMLLLASSSSLTTTDRSSASFVTAFTIEASRRRPSQTTIPVIVTPSRRQRSLITLNVIEPETLALDFDVRQGGVRLAEESVIKLEGKMIDNSSSSAMEPTVTSLSRYTRIVAVDEALVATALARLGATVVATGSGRELYQDPGTSTVQTIFYGPTEAVRYAMQSYPLGMKATNEPTRLSINFCGGKDAQVLEVLDALRELTSSIPDVKAFKSMVFHSISHDTFPPGSSDVTLIAIPTSSTQSTADSNDTSSISEEDSVLKAIASGDLYCSNGKYYALMERDINPAIA